MEITEIPALPKEKECIRVAAYARVSSDKDAAFHSLEAQTDYYQQYITEHPGWVLAGIYSDNGISGATLNRPEFQRMLEDCRAGKIDMIITKSISRFARNTLILLESVRELKALGIDVYFEKEAMHSISPDGELLLTLLAMYAEEEARSASENQRWRIRKKFEQGQTTVGKMLGYRLKNGVLTIVPEEAEIVRFIFSEYLNGTGMASIAMKLNRAGVPSPSQGPWRRSFIYSVLSNEKHSGNMLLQKTYVPDFRSKVRMINRGERKKYFVEHSHEPIIDPETFQRVQAKLKETRDAWKSRKKSESIEQHLFSGLLVCGICGHHYDFKRTNAKKYDKAVWICPLLFELGKKYCPSQRIPESILIEKAKEVLGVEEITRQVLQERLRQIIVPEHNRLIFQLKDGEEVDVRWQHPSRRLSWTPEMRQKARERALEQHRKEREK